MIELPEAVTIARQLNEAIGGKRVIGADTGSSSHKWVFYAPSRGEVETELPGCVVDEVNASGRAIRMVMKSGKALAVDDFGGRVLYHRAGERLPKKYHLKIDFEDNSFITVAIQGWGFIALLTESERRERLGHRATAISPTDENFTSECFEKLLIEYEEKDKEPVKLFFTNGKSVAGIGNGYLQDILFRAKIDPRRKVGAISDSERASLYQAVKTIITRAIAENGRECEKDIFGNPGEYKPLMDRFAKDKPCPVCGTPIQKISYLGGSCYLCTTCQS
ncbi:hypothetical protein JXJ21_01975 [candidate division KSB1 bacterium]|nr:hypothetical protein [candidate division KSB1 bacterium]